MKKADEERKEELMKAMTDKQKKQFLSDIKNFQDQESKQGAVAEKKRVSKPFNLYFSNSFKNLR